MKHPVFYSNLFSITDYSDAGYPSEEFIEALHFTKIQKYTLLLNAAETQTFESGENRQNQKEDTGRKMIREKIAGPRFQIQNERKSIEIPACESISRLIFPRYGRNRSNQYRY